MEFWSKGLGKMTIALTLTTGETLKSEGTLCLRGNMEEPVSWEYVMKLGSMMISSTSPDGGRSRR